MTGQRETARTLVLAGSLVRHQVRRYLIALGIEWTEHEDVIGHYFTFEATEDQWSDVQAWVEKVTP